MVDFIIVAVVAACFIIGIVAYIKSRKKGGCAGCSGCNLKDNCDQFKK